MSKSAKRHKLIFYALAKYNDSTFAPPPPSRTNANFVSKFGLKFTQGQARQIAEGKISNYNIMVPGLVVHAPKMARAAPKMAD